MSATLSTIAVASSAAATITSNVLTATTSNGPSPTTSAASFGGKDTRPPGPPLSPEQLLEDHRYQIYWACAMNMIISTIFFAIRMASRKVTKVRPKLSDWLLLAGVVFSFGTGAVRRAFWCGDEDAIDSSQSATSGVQKPEQACVSKDLPRRICRWRWPITRTR